jgi:uncharacterized repeat protein (TIGR01451 family)
LSSTKKLAAFLGVVVVLVLCVVPIASAHSSSLTASLDCNGNVSWSVSSSTENDGTVTVSDNSGQQASELSMTSANHWTVSGTFSISTSITSDTISASVVWGDGYIGGQPGSVTVHRPSNCKAAPSISTQLSASSIALGGSAHDTATLTGATSTAGGTVTYTIFSDSGCSQNAQSAGTVSVTNGSVPNSNPITCSSPGTYYWQASYSGDSHNNGATSPCTSEQLVVGKAQPSIATQLSSSSITIGGSVNDTATLTGATSNAGGTVAYTVYSDSSCDTQYAQAGTVNVTSGSVPNSNSITFNAPGTYYWQAVYSGDSNNSGATSPCTSEQLVVGQAQPSITTSATGGVTVGGQIHDVATLSGVVGATGAVTFEVFAPGDTTCAHPLTTLQTSTKSVDGNGNGTYTSASYTTTTAGTYTWEAFFASDANNAAANDGCAAEGESSIVNQAHPAISTQAPASVTTGSSITDVATLSGAVGATGAVTFNVYGPSDTNCTSTPVAVFSTASKNVDANGNGTYTSQGYTTTADGTYRWRAFFAGDANNAAVNDACNAVNESTTASTPPTTPPTNPSVSTPAISITKNPKSQTIATGGTANFTIVVTNTSNVTLTNVTVSDALTPGCNESSATIAALASMAPGASVTYNCSLSNVAASFTNSATATGTPPSGPNVTSTDTAPVTVTPPPPKGTETTETASHPAIAIVKDPASQTVAVGGTATFHITVTNTGDVTLSNVTVTDPLSTDCSRTLGTLAAGQSKSYSCTKSGVTAGFTNVATATGKPPTGAAVKASDHANVSASPLKPPAAPRIAIVKSPKSQTLQTQVEKTESSSGATKTTVHYGTASFTIKVTNTGNTPLHNVTVSDPLTTGCDRNLGSMAAGASKTYNCSRSAVTASFTNVATATGTSPAGTKVKSTDHAHVTVNVKTTNTAGAQFTG